MRGGHRSKPIEDLVVEAAGLAKNGVKELILIAQDSTYYGLDLYKERRLADLLRALTQVDGIEWIRLHYAFPSGFPEDVLDVIAKEPKVCSYIDIPLQHISDPILKSMRRGTTQKKTTALLQRFRAAVPEMAIRTSLILGYPGETEEDFELLKDWVQEMRFERLGCFQYSHEENTHAHSLVDDVPPEVKQARVNELMAIQAQISWEKNQTLIGKTLGCVIDRKEGNYFVGRTEYDSPDVDNEVWVDASKHYLKVGDFAQLTIVSAQDFDLHAVPAN
jgi:ribosomal protein S12 methylthiotransferase